MLAASDQGQLIADLVAIPPSLGPPQCVLADNGYLNEEDVTTRQQREIEGLIATGTEERRYDFDPPSPKPPREPKADWIRAISAN